MSQRILGVEGGGTKTAWVLVEQDADAMRVLEQGKLPASNVRLTSPEKLRAIFSQMPAEADRVGMFLAGCAVPAGIASIAVLRVVPIDAVPLVSCLR